MVSPTLASSLAFIAVIAFVSIAIVAGDWRGGPVEWRTRNEDASPASHVSCRYQFSTCRLDRFLFHRIASSQATASRLDWFSCFTTAVGVDSAQLVKGRDAASADDLQRP